MLRLILLIILVQSAVATEIRILAFGDSLTEGLTDHSTRFHPYSIKLQQLLQGLNPDFQVDETGKSGEQVLVSMRERLVAKLSAAATQGWRYQWVLILAGINDIGYGSKPEHIFQALRKMYHACSEHGSRVVVMTNMENAGTGINPRDAARQRLNSYIREYASRHAGPSGPVLLDLDKLLPFASSRELFDDGLHLTDEGYDRLGELLFNVLQPFVSSSTGM